jgi:uncharacterized integral membrane protein (TIGR00698 family)
MQKYLVDLGPGLSLCCFIALAITLVTNSVDITFLDPLVIALVVGALYKNIFSSSIWHVRGSKIAEKYILELSIVMLGASIFLPDVASAGAPLFILIAVGVVGSMLIALFVGYWILNLDGKLVTLIGVSNSICGNAAAATIAPIIGASSTQLATVMGISSILGAAQIILLPLLVSSFGLTDYHYGIVSGMAVYAVSQVYAASATVSATSASVATFVKLCRVMLLAPTAFAVQTIVSLRMSTASSGTGKGSASPVSTSTSINRYLPWFVIGFLLLAILRSTEIINEGLGDQIRQVSRYSFLIAMTAVGMSVDIREIFNVGLKVAVVICSVIAYMLLVSLIGGQLIL